MHLSINQDRLIAYIRLVVPNSKKFPPTFLLNLAEFNAGDNLFIICIRFKKACTYMVAIVDACGRSVSKGNCVSPALRQSTSHIPSELMLQEHDPGQGVHVPLTYGKTLRRHSPMKILQGGRHWRRISR